MTPLTAQEMVDRALAMPHRKIEDVPEAKLPLFNPLRKIFLEAACQARIFMQIDFLSEEENPELLLPASASDCAWLGAKQKIRHEDLMEEPLGGFIYQQISSLTPRKTSVRTTRAAAPQEK